MRKTVRNIMGYMTGALFNVIFILLAVVAVYFIGTRAYAFGMDLFTNDMSGDFVEIIVEIPEGEIPNRADAMTAARILEEAEIINSAWVFYLEARLNGTHNLFRPGTYEFNTHMSNGDIMDIMQRAQFALAEDIRFRVPEGVNMREIGELAENQGLFTQAEFLEAANEYARGFFFLEPIRWRDNFLEGYLFPNTYNLPQNPRPQDLIDRMLTEFQRVVFDNDMEERAEAMGLTIDEVVIIASIIEREVRVPHERALVSAIIHNRLAIDMPLQMCSTVQFVLDVPRDRLLFADLEIDSPFNTYRHRGLPIGPIANPGRAALEAALNPADVDYLFMVLMDTGTGQHFFSNNYADHSAANRRYNRDW